MNTGNANVKLEITVEDLNNLMVFMERIDLKGKEVPAYNRLVYKMNQAMQLYEQSQKQLSQPIGQIVEE